MSLISCVNSCVYQEEGYCTLERAASTGQTSEKDPCVHFVPKHMTTKSKHPIPLSNSELESEKAPPAAQPSHPVLGSDRRKTPGV